MGADEHRWHTMVPGEGASPCDALFVGTIPGPMETKARKPFVSQHGRMLRQVASDILGDTVWYVNLVNQMHTVGGKPKRPPRAAFHTGRERIANEVRARKPKIVVAVGSIPTEWLVGLGVGVLRDHGQPIQSEKLGFNITVVPIYDPSFVARRGGLMGAVGDEWMSDIELVRDRIRGAS